MNSRALWWLTAFVIALIGWLVAARVPAEGAWGAAILIGVLAAAATGRAEALPALWLGILVAYPVALALDANRFLGDGWPVALVLAAVLSSVGFFGWLIALRVFRTLQPGS
jgi:hypothetical protein